MLKIASVMIVCVAICANVAYAQDVDYATLEVRVESIRNHPGEIGVALFNSPKGYPVHLEHAYEPKWVALQAGQDAVEVVFEGVPFGTYAVSVLHDENGNRKLERSALGFPREGVGFSNGQKVTLGAPSFKASAFTLSEAEPRKIVITLDYRE